MKDSTTADIKSPVPSAPVLDAEALFRAHASWLAGYVKRLGFRGQDVEDIVQDTFLVAHRRGGFEPGLAQPTTWLAEIATRTGMARRRAGGRAPVADEEAVLGLPAARTADPSVVAQSAQALDHAQRALGTLPLERRALFVLFELEGESCESLAATFEVPIGTIYSRLHKARREFRSAYESLTRAPSGTAKRAP